jgi:rhodanese-related sulfurtransferase
MKRLLTIIFVLIFALGSAGTALAKDSKLTKNIGPQDAHNMMNKDSSVYVIDVRTPWEFQFVGHVKNSYNIPFNLVSNKYTPKGGTYVYTTKEKVAKKGRYQWRKNPDFLKYVGQLVKEDKNAKIIVYCRSAKRSAKAADTLFNAGYKHVMNMQQGFEGGFGDPPHPYRRMKNGWQHAGLPYQYMDKIKNLDPKFTYQGAF